ncbi:MAG TPA: asparagine synthase (glutamine-hydrolyzing) [Bacteroidia bacterium]|nr:asparagine synthase (glutamine-hydrolyzing) [Bacteroidia bacterium]
MCGILGYIGSFDRENLDKGLTRISHRGPDGSGTFFHNSAALGHRRLSIIDLSDKAKQPFEVLDRYVITYNGEIYNYPELKKELQADGFKFKSDSDTEVLLYSYVKWGRHFVTKLNGMWAFAIYDKSNGTLLLSRDRLGKKPLFYSLSKKGIVFASEMKGIYPFLEEIGINYEVTGKALNNSFGYESTENCLIKNILRFPAASVALYENGQLRFEKFWDADKIKTEVAVDYETQKERFRELFLDACRIRMRSDVTIGTALSGGLDSSAVICAMAHLSKSGKNKEAIQKDWQHAFVASFPGTELDETKYAKTVTNHLGISAHFLNIDPVKDIDDIFYKTYLFEELFYAPVTPFVQLYEKIKQSKVTVSIDGHGADELFGGYPFDMNAALIDSLPAPGEFKQVLEAINHVSGKEKNADRRNKLKYAALNRYPFLQKFSTHLNLVPKKEQFDFLNSALFESSFKTILPTLLRNYDRYSMMNGVEIRMPFLDHRIVEFAFSIPYSSKIRNGYSKAIVRDALADLMPQSIAYRKHKIGFNAPMNSWMNLELKTWINDLVHSADFNNCTLIDKKEVFDSITKVINKKEIPFMEGTRVFEKLIPVIWEKSLSYAT